MGILRFWPSCHCKTWKLTASRRFISWPMKPWLSWNSYQKRCTQFSWVLWQKGFRIDPRPNPKNYLEALGQKLIKVCSQCLDTYTARGYMGMWLLLQKMLPELQIVTRNSWWNLELLWLAFHWEPCALQCTATLIIDVWKIRSIFGHTSHHRSKASRYCNCNCMAKRSNIEKHFTITNMSITKNPY